MATNTPKGRRAGPGGPEAAPSATMDLKGELIAPLREFDTLARQVSQDLFKEVGPSLESWARGTTQAISAVESALQTFQVVASEAFLGTGDAMTGAGIAASIYGENVGKAMERAAKAALASVAEQAGVNALNALAQGLWFLAQAIFFADPDAAAAAATDFEAAAEWGAIAGVAGAAAAAIPAGKGSTYGREGAGRYGGGGAPQTGGYGLAPGAAGALNPPSGNLTVMVVGEAAAGQWLATTLNTAVQRGVPLNATTVQRTPYAAG